MRSTQQTNKCKTRRGAGSI
uniref:Uncharacterized protein n=1 Tax=Anguilla anguilla TaxID=7936 RepID=A0A0E9TAB4_ANGAN